MSALDRLHMRRENEFIYPHTKSTVILETAAAVRFFSAILSLLTYKLVYWSERPISTGTVFALVLMSASITTLFTTDVSLLLDHVMSASAQAMSVTRDVVMGVVSPRDEL